MIEPIDSTEIQPQKIVLEGGVLEPIMDIVKEKEGYRYTVRVLAKEKGSDWLKQSIYYLKPDSDESKIGTVERYVHAFYLQGDIYDTSGSVDVLPEGTTYQLEQTNNPDNTQNTILTLTLPHKIPKINF
ncbi:hypothetical protein A3F00_04130 [Candidatus Daviesbacteria bacterium RIFCSPHIGHO2_12_FULL_37_11]|uniref:Uncharacterized protein n=1 Tax=Candidatus Daviesbacteria bacterium RIFCSPHIGHO2_12_FULL_37_11 TaxID=1797777 RepID=A0A1F5KE76_9BACT|nr:MAG: hypothetical protein A3F00_04130 [Candidatus Daviesbacteria bacterium RIFCSPHIGHO2_12_FULL_37_11]